MTIMFFDSQLTQELDPGIRDRVLFLRSLGFETCDSGDGFSKLGKLGIDRAEAEANGIRAYPHVVIKLLPEDDFKGCASLIYHVLLDRGDKAQVQVTWSPNDNIALIDVSWNA